MSRSLMMTLASMSALCASLACRGRGCEDEPDEPPCEPRCNGACGIDDGCGDLCECEAGEDCVLSQCLEHCPFGRCGLVCSLCRDGFCPGLENEDQHHCGWPDECVDCGSAAVCSDGQCKACPAGTTICGSTCETVDDRHCGPHCTDCPEDSRCIDGDCRCNDPHELFCGTCVVPDTPEHCGGCGPCPNAGEVCAAGKCQCPAGQILCGQACVAANTNEHCGTCAQTCPTDTVCKPRASIPCQCKKKFFDYCDDVGQCVDTRSDPLHCGDCATQCGGDQVCRGGRCVRDNGGCDPPCSGTKPCCWKTNRCETKSDCDHEGEPPP